MMRTTLQGRAFDPGSTAGRFARLVGDRDRLMAELVTEPADERGYALTLRAMTLRDMISRLDRTAHQLAVRLEEMS